MITDTHAHLYYPELKTSLSEVLMRAEDEGIKKIIVPAVDLNTSREVIEMSEKHDMIFAALGVHPCDVKDNQLSVFDELEKLLGHEKVVAIGETGLDYYWDNTNSDDQKIFFKHQIGLAKKFKLPIVIHTRDSIDDAIKIIKEDHDENLSGQFHCFSGDERQLREILELDNFYVSYCGNITYKNFKGSDVIGKTPLNRLLSETDSPFLPPVPFRGKKNEPSYIVNTIRKISEIKEIDLEILLNEISDNCEKLFWKKNEY
ncbi:MAG TPA: TatD family hydrolase [Ignavibacteria bacterium]|nr:TatD family hydrolase [Ignavibacteria bacterium]